MLKVNNKDIRMMSMTSTTFNLNKFRTFFGISIAEFEHVLVCWKAVYCPTLSFLLTTRIQFNDDIKTQKEINRRGCYQVIENKQKKETCEMKKNLLKINRI